MREANHLCMAAEARLAQIPEPSWRAGLEVQSAYLRAQLPVYRGLLANLRALTAPPGDLERTETFWDELGGAIDRIAKAAHAAQVGDEIGYETFGVGGFEQLMDVRWLMSSYGFESCLLGQPD